MKFLSRLVAAVTLLLTTAAIAAPADAVRIEKSWDLAVEKWNRELAAAATADDRAQVLTKRPDATPFARQMWEQIGPSLADEWTLEPAAWFLTVTPGLLSSRPDGSTTPTFTAEIEAIRKSVETRHLYSKGLTPVCVALISSQDPRSLAILEKVQDVNPDPKIQGVAALGAAMILKTLGDAPDLIRKRLNYLRKAIIQASDVALPGTTVAKMAEDELYIIRYLSKGRVAPDLVGTDSGGRALKLSTYQGKVVMLVFWSSYMPEAKRVVEMITTFKNRTKDPRFVVLGVCMDSLKELRDLESDDTVTWTSFSDPDRSLSNEYRVTRPPTVYVLDGNRKIQYVGAPGSFAELTAQALLSGKP